jgi:hypothetical protein
MLGYRVSGVLADQPVNRLKSSSNVMTTAPMSLAFSAISASEAVGESIVGTNRTS